MKDRIIELLKAGKSYDEIVAAVGCSKATITYHAKRLGLSSPRRPTYDWAAIQSYYNEGHSAQECRDKFGCSNGAMSEAVNRRVFKHRPPKPLDEYLVETCQGSRFHIKRKLIESGALRNECYECRSPPVWRGKKLVMVLDHINGIHDDYRRENLRLLCPNCNSQMDTFAGRNRKKTTAGESG